MLAAAVDEESAAIMALGEELVGSDRPIVIVSGTPWIPGRVAESDPLPTEGPVGGRAVTVDALLEMSSRSDRSTAVRLPRTVHSDRLRPAGRAKPPSGRDGHAGGPARAI